jgi:hypothetical protein
VRSVILDIAQKAYIIRVLDSLIIKELIEKNIIRRVGKGKDTYYIFVTE